MKIEYRQAAIEDAEVLAKIYNASFYDDYLRFGSCPGYGQTLVFLIGKHDYTCHFSLQQKYYEELEAPSKAIYIFENSAHSPIHEEYDTAKSVLEEVRR